MNEQTFYFTNMTPQDPYLNGGLWVWLEELLQCDLFPNLLSKVGPQEAAAGGEVDRAGESSTAGGDA